MGVNINEIRRKKTKIKINVNDIKKELKVYLNKKQIKKIWE